MEPTTWSLEVWRALWRAVPAPLAVLDPERVRLTTPSWDERWPACVEGRPWVGALPPAAEKAVRQALAGAVAKGWLVLEEERWRLQARPVAGRPRRSRSCAWGERARLRRRRGRPVHLAPRGWAGSAVGCGCASTTGRG